MFFAGLRNAFRDHAIGPADSRASRGPSYRTRRVLSRWVELGTPSEDPLHADDPLSGSKLLKRGNRGATVEIPGPQALVRSKSAKPIFYVRGFSPANGMYLVRTKAQREYRDVQMRLDHRFLDGPQFRSRDLYPFDVNGVAADVVTLTPRANLEPGEYVIVPAIEAGYTWIQFAYGFGVSAGAGAP